MGKIFFSESYGNTDIGPIRMNNEDEYLLLPDWNFFAIADGIGGHKGGDVAARKTLEILSENLIEHLKTHAKKKSSVRSFIQEFKRLICSTNHWIYRLSKDHDSLKGMGTTLCCLYLYKKNAIYAHVGDSRVYLFRKNKLRQLTQDHSLLQKWINKGKLHTADSIPFSFKNIITKAIGTQKALEPDITYVSLQDGDVFFMCTDGLSDVVSFETIEKTLQTEKNLQESVNQLIEIAKQNHSHDNITALIVRIVKK